MMSSITSLGSQEALLHILDMATMGSRIRELRVEAGISQAAFGKPLGVSREAVSQWEKGKSTPEQPKLEAIADRYKVTLGWLAGKESKPLGDANPGDNNQSTVARPNQPALTYVGKLPAPGPRDLPILGHVKAGVGGEFYDQGGNHGFTMRPDSLLGVKAAYAVRVRDMSMYPAYEPNDLVHVNPTLAVVPDSNVVIQLINGEAFVKRLIRRTEKHVICKEWFPEAREIRYDAKQVQTIHTIIRPT